jgi:hypothetical protein
MKSPEYVNYFNHVHFKFKKFMIYKNKCFFTLLYAQIKYRTSESIDAITHFLTGSNVARKSFASENKGSEMRSAFCTHYLYTYLSKQFDVES